jgi:hypothetical protein
VHVVTLLIYSAAWNNMRASERVAVGRGVFRPQAVALIVAALLASPAAAQADGLGGYVGISYGFSLLATDAPLAGPVVRSEITYRAGRRNVTFSVAPVSLSRQNLDFSYGDGANTVTFSARREPGDGDAGATTDVQAVLLRRVAGAPSVQVVVSSQRSADATAASTLLARAALSDRIPGVLGLSALEWRASYQIARVSVPERELERLTSTGSVALSGAFGGARGRDWRPSLSLSATLPHDQPERSTYRLDAGIRGPVTPYESVSVNGRVEAGASFTHRESLSLRSSRFDPFTIDAEVDHRSDRRGVSTWGWSAGADAPVATSLKAGVTYRGSSGGEVTTHALRARLGAQLGPQFWGARASLEAGGAWRAGDWQPDAAVTASATSRGEGPLSGAFSASVRYDTRLSGSISGSVRYAGDQTDASLSVNAALGERASLGVSSVLAFVVSEAVALQVGADASFSRGGSPVASVDLGVRYAFGGNR